MSIIPTTVDGGTSAPASHVPTGPPLRVLRLIARLNVGGPARHAIILDDGLRRCGFETLLIYGAVGPAEHSLESLAVERGIPTRFIPSFGRAIRALDDIHAFTAIIGSIWRWRPDIVHTHTAKAGTLGRLAAALYNLLHRPEERCAVVHTFHGHVFEGYFGRLGTAFVRTAERVLAAITDRIVTISPAQQKDIVSRFSVAPDAKVAIIPLGLELDPLLTRRDEWRGMRTDLGYGPSDFVVGYVGRLVPIKDLSTLVRGIALARSHLPQLRLVIAGDGEDRQNLETLARALGIPEHVRFIGWQSDLPSLYAALDLFALTSINEGTPVSLIEAMAAGVPCIATRVGGVPDVIEDNVTGRLIPPGDPAALAEGIQATLEQRDVVALMTSRARTRVAERYNSERLIQDMAAMYRTEVTRRRRRQGE